MEWPRRYTLPLLLIWLWFGPAVYGQVPQQGPEKPAKPVLKITPGKVIIPFDRMRRIWGELVSLDLEIRTGTFRNESDDEVMKFTVMPYAELLHHAANGDLQDFKIGERAIFRMHENEQGQWVWLTYIQDEMNMLNGHQEYFIVEKIDTASGQLTTTWAKRDKSFIREENVVIETDANTRFWRAGQPAKFADIQLGVPLRTKTHGRGKGKSRVAWEVFLDDESLLKFQAEQKLVHAQRMKEEGFPGYVDASSDGIVELTLFREAGELRKAIQVKKTVRLAPAGTNRKPTAEPISGTVTQIAGDKISVTIPEGSKADFYPTGLARVWLPQD